MKNAQQKTAVVTGGNKGIGLETCRQLAKQGYVVFLGARDPHKGEAAAKSLAKEGLDVRPLPLDVDSDESVIQAAALVKKFTDKVHALVNCAGVFPDKRGPESSPFEPANFPIIRAAIETNTIGALRTLHAFLPLLEKSSEGCIVNVSSGMGQLSDMNGGSVGYRLSKVSLNAITRIAHAEVGAKGILVNSVCPGWVKTDMGGPGAEREVSEGASGVVWAATLPKGGPSGGFFRDGKPIPW